MRRLPCYGASQLVKTGLTGMNEDGRSPSSSAIQEDQGEGEVDKHRRAALELCFYQPSIRGRTKRRSAKLKERSVDGGKAKTPQARRRPFRDDGGSRSATQYDSARVPRRGSSPRHSDAWDGGGAGSIVARCVLPVHNKALRGRRRRVCDGSGVAGTGSSRERERRTFHFSTRAILSSNSS